jgi:hypothetical protein
MSTDLYAGWIRAHAIRMIDYRCGDPSDAIRDTSQSIDIDTH